MKPRIRFCWYCGKKLWGNHYTEIEKKEDGHSLIMHKSCAVKYLKGEA